jgi:predicted nucleotidyltransferase component of viral defense system
VKETLIDPEVAEEVEVVNLKVEEVEVLVVAVVAEVEGIMPIGVEQMRKALSEEVEDIILLEEAISEAVKAHHLILYPNMMIKMMSMVKTLIIKIIRRYNSRSHSRSLQDLFVLQTTSLRKTRKLA